MNNETILIVDDEKEIVDLVEIYLRNEGFEVKRASDGEEALKIAQEGSIDLAILDIMMPKMNGLKVCEKIREKSNMPIIMLSAKSRDEDKIEGLSTGADDYVTKPFNPMELVARIKSQLRRYKGYGTNLNKDEIVVEDMIINVLTHEVTIAGKKINLTPTEFGILNLLAKNRGVVHSIEKIYEEVWDQNFYEAQNTVMVHIRKIREKIEDNSRNPKYIKTVWGVGYKIEN